LNLRIQNANLVKNGEALGLRLARLERDVLAETPRCYSAPEVRVILPLLRYELSSRVNGRDLSLEINTSLRLVRTRGSRRGDTL
jgi:hypothetical protein